MIEVDGARGEGGGQILRSALSLSVLTRQPFRIYNIRAGRPNPGLRPQHLQSVRAASAICDAGLEGDSIGSLEVRFAPGRIKAGTYHFDIGTAGATTLVLQTLCLPLAFAGGTSSLTITGGTHVPWSPCFHYLDLHWVPLLARLA